MTHRTLRFPSLHRPNEFGYEVTTDDGARWESAYRAGARQLARWFVMFPTMGDGMCQHGSAGLVFERDWADALASLATFALTRVGTEDQDALERIFQSCWPSETNYAYGHHNADENRIVFLAGVKFDPKKTKYLALEENKVSTADAKRHDRRWIQVPEYADGGLRAIDDLLRVKGTDGSSSRFLEYATELDFIEHWARFDRVRSVVRKRKLDIGDLSPYEHFKLDRKAVGLLHSAFDICEEVRNIFLSMAMARGGLSAYQHNAGLDRPKEESAA